VKSVLITGCSSGFGLSLTKALLKENWRVIATARHPETSSFLQELNHPLLTILKLDVTKKTDLEEIQHYITNELQGHLDCLINNAGYGLLGPFEELTEQQIREQMEVNLFGVIFLTKICLPALRKAQGRIINISSLLGYLVFPLQSLYVTSKFALEGLSETLHYELAPHNVQVTLLEPGGHNTRFGANVVSSQTEIDDVTYHLQKNNFIRFRKKLTQRKSNSPEKLAECVIKLLNKKTMPVRKRVGGDAEFIYLLKRILPDAMFNYLLTIIYKRIFLTSHKK